MSGLIRNIMKKMAWILRFSSHPVFVFVGLQIIWLAITLMWVIWFVDSFQEITKLARIAGSSYFDNHYALMVLIIGCVLLGMLFLGTLFLFITSQRQRYLMAQQKSFVSSVTHELRSPLASLQLSFETMRSRTLDKETQNTLYQMVEEDIHRLGRLVDHILVSSRLDRGLRGFSEERESLNLREVIQQSVHSNLWLDAELYQRLDISCSEELGLTAPKPAISLILSNLLENAIKYSPSKSPIKISAIRQENIITLTIQDHGLGLGNAEKKRIFKMFHRAPVTQKKAIPGTGIGLFIVKSLVRSLGGHVRAESPGRDKGSTFIVTLPIQGDSEWD
ncbi:MAG: HAMP domain-containing histidine kinase [Deltaproteobacteria bacterium]|nr:HAMP domain-containing histidine kinase [Deltaproteobacteria bacterium]